MTEDVGATSTTITDLRHELKIWEKSFAAANGGRKAGREDIKKDATISAKYKEYDRLARRATKQATTPQKKTRRQSATDTEDVLRDRPVNVISRTPKRQEKASKLGQPAEVLQEQELEEGPTPAIIRCALGPTPQKDGEILGLFDMLSGGTPSKTGDVLSLAASAAVGATPSKPKTLPSSVANFSRTPQSSAKRKFLEAFAGTPLKREREYEAAHTPSTAKRQYATPAFLRRNFSLAPIDEEGNDVAVAARPFKKRGIVRSLSTIIQNLKKHEDERMDDEWDIMNEIEAEKHGESKSAPAPKVLVEDSRAIEMPLGPDKGVESGDESSEHDAGALDANGKPRKVWKKKGLKRQTRRIIMRPVLQKSKTTSAAIRPESDEDDTQGIAETQLSNQHAPQLAEEEQEEDADVRTAADSDYRHDSHLSAEESATRKLKKTKKPKAGASHEQLVEDNGGSKKAKKVSAQAHANFRRLKIKSKNSKAKGKGGRFGRR